MTERPWKEWAQIVVAVGAVLGALFANLKSCSMQEMVEEYAFENDSLATMLDSVLAERDRRTDSVVVVLDRHERLLSGDKPIKKRPMTRVRRVRAQRPWWQVW